MHCAELQTHSDNAMIVRDELEQEIARLENSDTTYANCEKLSVLYAVRDGLPASERQFRQTEAYSYAADAKTEFGAILARCSIPDVLPILEEHFEAIKAVHPREYNAVVRQIKEKSRG